MSNNRGAERRAQKAERRAQNIRKHARPNDRGAERRAQKAERRAKNIRDYADVSRPDTGPNVPRNRSSRPSPDGDANAALFGGCLVIVFVIVVVTKIVEEVHRWFDGLF